MSALSVGRSTHAPFTALALFAVMAVTLTAQADEPPGPSADRTPHPVSRTVRFLTSRLQHIQSNVRDFTCRQIQRERINGVLQEYQFCWTSVLCERRSNGQIVQPLSVFMHYFAPQSVNDRKVLFVDGQNGGMMLVRKGGSLLGALVLTVDPLGDVAKAQSKYPITSNSFDVIVKRLLKQMDEILESDPGGSNTNVTYYRNARVDDRPCFRIDLLHPKPMPGLKYHRSSWYFDEELHVPLRIVNYDWPEREVQEPPIVEEYIFADLKTNVGLTDDAFTKTRWTSWKLGLMATTNRGFNQESERLTTMSRAK